MTIPFVVKLRTLPINDAWVSVRIANRTVGEDLGTYLACRPKILETFLSCAVAKIQTREDTTASTENDATIHI
eukprot:3151840-Pyramimonas_sp.AAC.1